MDGSAFLLQALKAFVSARHPDMVTHEVSNGTPVTWWNMINESWTGWSATVCTSTRQSDLQPCSQC